jgi:hypothetical protein
MQREMGNIHKILVRNPEEKNPLGRLRHDSREYKIRMKLTGIMCEVDSSGSGQWWAIVNVVMKHCVSEKAGSFLSVPELLTLQHQLACKLLLRYSLS